jgi:glycine oxidase
VPQQSAQANQNADVVVIGGGVIGLSIARALALRGVRNVTVIEKGEFGREASWAAGGILAPQVEADKADDFFRLACAGRDLYPKFAQALFEETAIDVELDTTGTLYVAFSEQEENEFRARFIWQRSEGLEVQWLNGAEARALEANLSDQVRCALRFPRDYQVDNRCLVEALVNSNRRSGVRLIDNCAVNRFCVAGDHVEGVETDEGFVRAASVVVAAGAWSSAFNLEVKPVRGQMLCFRPERQMARHVIYSSRGYLIPRRDGRLVAGSTSERVGFDKQVTQEGIETIKTMAAEISPALALLPHVDSWAGFRPRAHDGLPVLGESPEIRRLFYATGHYRNGILLAPITAELMAEAILKDEISSLLSPFSPRRVTLHV